MTTPDTDLAAHYEQVFADACKQWEAADAICMQALETKRACFHTLIAVRETLDAIHLAAHLDHQ